MHPVLHPTPARRQLSMELLVGSLRTEHRFCLKPSQPLPHQGQHLPPGGIFFASHKFSMELTCALPVLQKSMLGRPVASLQPAASQRSHILTLRSNFSSSFFLLFPRSHFAQLFLPPSSFLLPSLFPFLLLPPKPLPHCFSCCCDRCPTRSHLKLGEFVLTCSSRGTVGKPWCGKNRGSTLRESLPPAKLCVLKVPKRHQGLRTSV